MDINTLKKSRVTDYKSYVEKLDSAQKTNYSDDRFWTLSQDKVGNGSAVIRFLPNVEGDSYYGPWVTTYGFRFQGANGRWYIENSLKTIGKDDPAVEMVNSLWASKDPDNIELAKSRRQSTQFISNILVVSDPKNPENEGKVFLFRYGKSIHNKLMGKLKPTFEDDVPVNPFDLWEGCNFKFRMRKKDGYANYDDSSFSDQCAIGSDDEILSVMKKRFDLSEFIDPSKFKSYDELKKKLDSVIGGSASPLSRVTANDMGDVPNFPSPQIKSSPAPTQRSVVSSIQDDDDEDALSYFTRLANEG